MDFDVLEHVRMRFLTTEVIRTEKAGENFSSPDKAQGIVVERSLA